jgi:hypothetical protein
VGLPDCWSCMKAKSQGQPPANETTKSQPKASKSRILDKDRLTREPMDIRLSRQLVVRSMFALLGTWFRVSISAP